jgi:hypothetical protein
MGYNGIEQYHFLDLFCEEQGSKIYVLHHFSTESVVTIVTERGHKWYNLTAENVPQKKR